MKTIKKEGGGGKTKTKYLSPTHGFNPEKAYNKSANIKDNRSKNEKPGLVTKRKIQNSKF